MRISTPLFRLTAAAAIAAVVLPVPSGPTLAQPEPPPDATPQQIADPPTRVGRIAEMQGPVSFHGPQDTEWSAAALNYPVAAGYSLWADPRAGATIEVSAGRIALAGGTELDLTALDDVGLQATLAQGEAYLRLSGLAPGETWTLRTPRGTVTIREPGRYLIAAGTTEAPTLVTVLEGAARIGGAGMDIGVAAGDTATLTGAGPFDITTGPALHDPFLDAMLAREPPPAQSPVPPAVAAMPGGADLSAYGSWSQAPEYGAVWYPQVAPGWVPYREGHWAYIAPWGWTWVDDAPWGFAPFHYGRWAEVGGRWAWVPGVAPGSVYHPVYAPALVTFLGVAAGVGFGAALAAGSVGWCPLGPREPYRPWYHASDRYLRRVNPQVVNVTTINRNMTINSYMNRRAATMVPPDVLERSRPVRQFARPLPGEALTAARPVFGAPPVRPTLATAGVTPGVARAMQLTPVPGAPVHGAPGPAIRAQGGGQGGGPPGGPRGIQGGTEGQRPHPPDNAAGFGQPRAGAQHPLGLPQLPAARPAEALQQRGIPPLPASPHPQSGTARQQPPGGPSPRAASPSGGVPPVQSGTLPLSHGGPGAGPAPPNAGTIVPSPGRPGQPGTPGFGGINHAGPEVPRPMPQVGRPGAIGTSGSTAGQLPQITRPDASRPAPVQAPQVHQPEFHAPQVQQPAPAQLYQPQFHSPQGGPQGASQGAPQVHHPEFHAPPPQVHQPEFHAPQPQVHQPAPPQVQQPAFHPPPQVQAHPAPPPQVQRAPEPAAQRQSPPATQHQRQPWEH